MCLAEPIKALGLGGGEAGEGWGGLTDWHQEVEVLAGQTPLRVGMSNGSGCFQTPIPSRVQPGSRRWWGYSDRGSEQENERARELASCLLLLLKVISDHVATEAELTEEESIEFSSKITIILSLVYKHTVWMHREYHSVRSLHSSRVLCSALL